MRREVAEAELSKYRGEGARAFRDGKPYTHCPYLTFPDCPEGKAWQNGWLAEKERQPKRYDHEFERGPYGVCRRCGSEKH